jgi:hypothetical protein
MMTDKELDEFIYVGENKFIELAMIFGDAWASTAIQIAAEYKALLAQHEPELVAWMYIKKDGMSVITDDPDYADGTWTPLYTAPQKKEWVGLTIEERDEIQNKVYGAVPHHVAFHHAIEQALKEKNA